MCINENIQYDCMGASAWTGDIGKYVTGIQGSDAQ